MSETQLYTIRQTAKLLGRSYSQVYRVIPWLNPRPAKYGSATVFSPEDIERLRVYYAERLAAKMNK